MFIETIGLVCVSAASSIRPADIGIADVEQAVDAIGTAIVEAHHSSRHWDPTSMPDGESTRQHLGGYTALAVLALVTAGHDTQASPLREAIARLREIEPDGTYAVSFRTQVWASLPDRFLPDLQRDVNRIIESFHWDQGGWDYLCRPVKRIPRVSPSTRHVAILALHAAARRGIKIPRPLLERVQQATIESQHENGGWSYYIDDTPTGSMTSAGVFSLVLVDELLAQRGRRTANADRDAAIAQGLAWLDERFRAMPCPGGGRCAKFPMYWLYSLERVALATGQRTLHQQDWMREAVAVVLDRLCKQDAEGVWHIKGRQSLSQLRQRCFAIMILHRASLPLACSHVSIDGDNSGSLLAAELVSNLLNRHEQESTWQGVSMTDTVDAWLEAPFLLIGSATAPRFLKPHYGAMARHDRSPDTSPAPSILEVDRIRDYVRRGGLVVVAAKSNGALTAWRRIGSLAIPQASWTKLKPENPAMNLVDRPKRKPRIEALMNGGRPLMFIVSKNIDAALPNIWAFATARHPFPSRLELGRKTPACDTSGAPLPIVFTYVPEDPVEHGAPDAFQTWCTDTGRSAHVQIVKMDEIEATKGPVIIQAAEELPPWQDINRLLVAGRTVLVTGTPEALVQAEAIAREAGLVMAPVRAPRWVSGALLPGGTDLTHPGWNTSTRQQGRILPSLDVLCAKNAAGGTLLLSRADIAHALLDRPCWGIYGYDTRTARLLLWNLMQFTNSAESSPVAYLETHATLGMVDNRNRRTSRRDDCGPADTDTSGRPEASRNHQHNRHPASSCMEVVHNSAPRHIGS
ncbi:MAG: hypothetical protein GY894_05350 [Planctomycetes bacterium]|jgi:hypothetical protein|nr:hypothetical protein [Planctomycetota bacterium]MCP4838773.1 hypothetical protein [Planctomycetota bacterium]